MSNLEALKTRKISWVQMRTDININNLIPCGFKLEYVFFDFMLDGGLSDSHRSLLLKIREIRKFSDEMQEKIYNLETIEEVNDFDISFDLLLTSEEYKKL